MSDIPVFDNEVVTSAHVRYVPVPALSGEAALITLDNGFDHKKPTSLGPAGLANLEAAMDEIEAHSPAVRLIAVTGKPFIFCVGADVTGMHLLRDREQAKLITNYGHRVFARFRDSAIPTFAFVNGATMGGGLELALHCDYRTLSSGVPAIAFPECFLGIVPAWGGTQLLANLIGADNAVKVIIENPLNQNRMLRAKQAYQLGIADLLLEPADFIERSLDWAVSVVAGQTQVQRREIERGEAWAAALAQGRAIADVRLHGGAPAPYRALELMAKAETAPFAEGTAAEDEVNADLLMSEEFRAGLYSFDLVQRRAKRPAGAPDKSLARPVTKVGVLGAGLMASQLALLFARRLEVPVVLTDLDQSRVDKGVAYVHTEVDKLLGKGRISADKANRLKASVTGSIDKSVFADADFLIEAVFEDMAVKKALFSEIESVIESDAILATNTSSLSITEMAADLKHPERVVGFHFFNPVAVLPLLEIVRGETTDDATLATAFAVSKQLKKNSVLCTDSPAFVVNRLLTRFLGEVFSTVDEGTPVEVADSALEPLGLPMSPFVLLQFVGMPVAHHVSETLHAAYPDRFKVSDNLARLIEAGKPGVYVWDEQGRQSVDPDLAKLLKVGDTVLTAEQVRDRALSALAQEARLMLDEGVVAEAADLDLCMILGAGWPFHLGGITPYLDRTGYSEKVTGKRFQPRGVASLPA
ncbi:3-hydroxyacyl-CoA dehydrogenase [Actinocatenispora sera]|uniref:3-hydroxyacyl-CoA dehydrogenase n=1 Tax=Actinocatenispora sera TaxID=390989 RepID=A0A810L3X2_9ACTN|nr:3-hydroxyacyl-CoA dehydrogenase [Actinocatenispora sera]